MRLYFIGLLKENIFMIYRCQIWFEFNKLEISMEAHRAEKKN